MLMLSRTKIVVSISQCRKHTRRFPVHLLSDSIRSIRLQLNPAFIQPRSIALTIVLSVPPLAAGIVPSFDAFVYAKTDTSYEICVTETPAADSC